MRTIHKFELPIDATVQTISLPEQHRFLAGQFMLAKRLIYVWFEVPADMTLGKRDYRFKVFSTGDGIPDSYKYLCSCFDQYIPESYHLYVDTEALP